MSEQQLSRLRLPLTLLATIAELANLMWEHFNGGVVSHHLLDRSDLPAISNWWSALLIPALTWFLIGRIQKRLAADSSQKPTTSRLPVRIIAGFVGALFFGMLLSASFTNGYETLSTYLFESMILLALLFRVYRAECVLGFVLGMTFTFGAVLPTLIGSTVSAVSAVIHLCIRPVLVYLWTWFKRPRSPNA